MPRSETKARKASWERRWGAAIVGLARRRDPRGPKPRRDALLTRSGCSTETPSSSFSAANIPPGGRACPPARERNLVRPSERASGRTTAAGCGLLGGPHYACALLARRRSMLGCASSVVRCALCRPDSGTAAWEQRFKTIILNRLIL